MTRNKAFTPHFVANLLAEMVERNYLPRKALETLGESLTDYVMDVGIAIEHEGGGDPIHATRASFADDLAVRIDALLHPEAK